MLKKRFEKSRQKNVCQKVAPVLRVKYPWPYRIGKRTVILGEDKLKLSPLNSVKNIFNEPWWL